MAVTMMVLAPVGVVACDDGASGSSRSTLETSVPVPSPLALPLVGQIESAIEALEAELGGPQRYFEVNATSKLVNLFVALNDGAVVQAWVYLDGTLSSSEGRAASGGTFTLADLDFDPAAVLTQVATELPGSTLETFYVNGDGEGNVQYGVLVTSAEGGGLDVLVAPDGEVLAVDPLT
jgi:hypothetical protein